MAQTLTLTRRSDGRYCKKIDGKIHYFGYVEEEARQQLLDLLRLRTLHTGLPDAVTVQDVAESFAAQCRQRIASDTMQTATFDDYDGAIALFVRHVGPSARVVTLRADQFASFRAGLAKRLGTWALDRNIQAIRTMFKWAFDNSLIDTLPRFGDRFRKSTPTERGYEQAERRREQGERRFEIAELRQILMHQDCKGDLRTFTLLGLNAGFYSIDCSDLEWPEIEDKNGLTVVNRLRGKTNRRQIFPCWPEVAKAIGKRRRAKTGRVFETFRGNPWNRDGIDSISMMFQRIRKAAKVKRAGLGFGALRHTHVSAVGSLGDPNAARLVRGHQIEGIDRHYDFPSLERLKAVTDHARQVLLLNSVRADCDWIELP